MKEICGIYQIQSKIKPNKIYVGRAVSIRLRWTRHRYELRHGVHDNSKLQNHYNKYTESDLEFSIVEQFDFISWEHLQSREQYYLDSLKPWFNINMSADGNAGGVPWNKGKKGCFSQVTIEKMKLAKIGYVPWNKGKQFSQESRDKMSKSAMGGRNAKGSVRTPAMRYINGSSNRGKHRVYNIITRKRSYVDCSILTPITITV